MRRISCKLCDMRDDVKQCIATWMGGWAGDNLRVLAQFSVNQSCCEIN